jgi:flagellar FliJ protein
MLWHSICCILGKDKGKKMAGFKFALEKVLQYKEQLEKEVKSKLANLNAQKERLQERHASLKKDELFQEQKLGQTPVTEMGERWLIDNYIKALRQDIQQTQKNIAMLDRQIEQTRLELAQKAKDKKVMEKLKEKHFERYKKEEQLKEQRNLDEIASIRFKAQTY